MSVVIGASTMFRSLLEKLFLLISQQTSVNDCHMRWLMKRNSSATDISPKIEYHLWNTTNCALLVQCFPTFSVCDQLFLKIFFDMLR